MENSENEHLSSANYTEGNILLKERTQTINSKVKLPINKLGNWLINHSHDVAWPFDWYQNR